MNLRILLFLLAFFFSAICIGQGSIPMSPGMGVFTCFSGVDNGPFEQNPDGFVVGVADLRDPLGDGAPFSQDATNNIPGHWSTPAANIYHHSSWTARNLGELFGVAITEGENPDIFVSATGVVFDEPRDLFTGTLGGGNTGGDIYKLDGVTGVATKLASLPNTIYQIERPNVDIYDRYVGLGQITYNGDADVLYVSNLDDGLIYSLNANTGAVLGTFDHGLTLVPAVTDDPMFLFSQLDRMVMAVGYNKFDGRLYYGLTNETDRMTEIWSIATDPNGAITGNPVLIDSRPMMFDDTSTPSTFYDIPSDISFSHDGARMLISESTQRLRSCNGCTVITPGFYPDQFIRRRGAHFGEVYEYTLAGNTWTYSQDYDIGVFENPPSTTLIRGTNSTGGSDYGYNNYGVLNELEPICGENSIVTLSDALHLDVTPDPRVGIYGIQISPFDNSATFILSGIMDGGQTFDATYPADTYFIDLDNSIIDFDKYIYGDIEVLGAPCRVIEPIPTITEWGILVLILAMLSLGLSFLFSIQKGKELGSQIV